LQADDEIGRGTNLTFPCIELYKTLFRHLLNRLHHIAKTTMLVIL